MTDKMCMNCKHRQKPDGKHITRGWCDNKKSKHFDQHIFKGDSCKAFVSKKEKPKSKLEVKAKGEDAVLMADQTKE